MTRHLTKTEKLERKIREVDVEITQLNVAHYAEIQRLFKQRLEAYLELENITRSAKEKP
jgi:hypothetical protein